MVVRKSCKRMKDQSFVSTTTRVLSTPMLNSRHTGILLVSLENLSYLSVRCQYSMFPGHVNQADE